MRDLSHICNLHHSSQQCQILNPVGKAREWTCTLMDTSWVHYCWATTVSWKIFCSLIPTYFISICFISKISLILLEYSWFSMLYWFLAYSKVNPLYIYIHPFFFLIQDFTEHCLDIPVLYSMLVFYGIYSRIHVLIPSSQFIPLPPPNNFPFGNQKFDSKICEFVSVL